MDEKKKRRKPWTEEELKAQKFGKITVLKLFPLSESRNHHAKDVLCKCDCGKEFIAKMSNVTSGNTLKLLDNVNECVTLHLSEQTSKIIELDLNKLKVNLDIQQKQIQLK